MVDYERGLTFVLARLKRKKYKNHSGSPNRKLLLLSSADRQTNEFIKNCFYGLHDNKAGRKIYLTQLTRADALGCAKFVLYDLTRVCLVFQVVI